MKATLIITHIHKLYATQRDQDAFLCLENAFVAVHHDRIIDLGTHDYHTWVDKDTRLIDAANEIVVPAFIDPHVRFSFNQKNGDNLRINRETMELFYKNGITTMAAEELPDIASTPFFELIRFKPKKKMALVDYHYLSNRILPKHFLLSTSFSYDSNPFYDLMPLASLLCMEQAVTEEEVLASMTLYPARKLHLQRQNGIRRGAVANMIVFQARDLHELFHSFGRRRLHRIIHKGVHIYPHVIV